MARQRRGRGGFRAPELRGTLGTLLRTTREVLERGAREGRERLDEALASRRRDAALAELGELVLELIRAGEIDLAELPEVREVVGRLDELDAAHPPSDEEEPPPSPSVRDRFDRRRPGKSVEDGTVASATWAPPTRKKKDGSAERVWRPPAAAAAAPAEAAPPAKSEKKAAKRGGISFDDDDLSEYMHPDDVPPKGSSDGKP